MSIEPYDIRIITADAIGETYSVSSSNTAQSIAIAKLINDNSQVAGWIMITIENAPIRLSFMTNARQDNDSSNALGHVYYPGQIIIIRSSNEAIEDILFISKVTGVHAILMITIGYFTADIVPVAIYDFEIEERTFDFVYKRGLAVA